MTTNKFRTIKAHEAFNVEQYPLTDQNLEAAQFIVDIAWNEAVKKFPWWPVNVYVGESIIAEEVGEAQKDALDSRLDTKRIQGYIKEHAQAAAMHIRQIQHLLNIEP